MGLSALFAMSVNAQTQIKLKTAQTDGVLKNKMSTAKVGPSNSTQQITGSITCLTQYVASSTMNLLFEIDLTNTDSEYGDLVTITFPAGITPNTNAANTPSIGTGTTAEVLNPIVGQTISWGDNDNSFGGVVPGTTYTISVNVTIGALTGNQIASYNVSGDTYGAGPGDLTGGSCTIYPAGATVVNMRAKYSQPSLITAINNCGLGMDQIYTRIINGSSAAQSNFPVNYSVNGVASTATVIAGPLAVGDSIDLLLPTPYDFSASNIYAIKAWVSQPGDINMANDTAALTISNSVSVPLTSATYSNGVESLYEYGSVLRTWVGTGLAFAADNVDKHSGVLSFNYNIPTTIGAPAGTYTAINVYPCVDVVAGETYRISWWNKVNTTPVSNGMVAITTGTAQTAAGTATVLRAYANVTPGSWVKDSVDYTPTVTGTQYFSVRGKGTLSATDAVNVKIDDVMISKVAGSVGVKENSKNLLSIFPNPSNGLFTLNTPENNSSVEVFNVIGENVYSKSQLTKGDNSIDLSNMAAGSYILKVKTGNEIMTKRIVITK